MQPKGFDTLDGPTPIPTRIVRCLTAFAHFAQCKPHKIVNGVGEMCDQFRELARAQVEDWAPTRYGLTAVASVAGIGTSYESPRL